MGFATYFPLIESISKIQDSRNTGPRPWLVPIKDISNEGFMLSLHPAANSSQSSFCGFTKIRKCLLCLPRRLFTQVTSCGSQQQFEPVPSSICTLIHFMEGEPSYTVFSLELRIRASHLSLCHQKWFTVSQF